MISFLFLVGLSFGSQTDQDKENTCFFLTHSAIKLKFQEIEKHLKQYPDLKRKDLIFKAHQVSFDNCINLITAEETLTIGLRRIRDFSPYYHLIDMDLSKFQTSKDLEVRAGFLQDRERIPKQISSRSSSSKDL